MPALRPTAAIATSLLVMALGLSACGSDDDSDSTSGASTSGAAVDVLGSPNKATGEPLTIGMVSNGKSPTVDASEEFVGGQAAVQYVNEYLGGVNGRPLKLQTCEDKGNPATGADCAQQFVTAKLPAVVSGTSGVIGQITKVLDSSGIPNYATSAAAADFLASPNAFAFRNPLTGFGTQFAVAREKKLTKVTSFVTDVPAASGPAKQLMPIFAANVGATVDVVPITPGTPDMSPQVSAANGKGTELFHIIGDPTFCTSAIKAMKGLGLKQPIVAIDNCVTPAAAKNIPGGFEGITVSAINNFDPKDAEFQLYKGVLDQYSSGGQVSAFTANGYGAVLGFARVMNAAKLTDYTPAGMIAATKAAPAVKVPVGGGATMQCTGTVSPFSKAVCADLSIVADGTADGVPVNYRNIDSTGIYVLPQKK